MVNGKMKLVMPFRNRTPGKPKARKSGTAKAKSASTAKGKERAVVEIDDDEVEVDFGGGVDGVDGEDDEEIDEADISTVWPPARPNTRKSTAKAKAPPSDQADLVTQCYHALLALRDECAIENDQPAQFISDEALQLLAAEMPRTCGAIEASLCVCSIASVTLPAAHAA